MKRQIMSDIRIFLKKSQKMARAGIYSKIKANMDDLELRHYYLKSCLEKTATAGEYAETVPDLMNMKEAANLSRYKR